MRTKSGVFNKLLIGWRSKWRIESKASVDLCYDWSNQKCLSIFLKKLWHILKCLLLSCISTVMKSVCRYFSKFWKKYFSKGLQSLKKRLSTGELNQKLISNFFLAGKFFPWKSWKWHSFQAGRVQHLLDRGAYKCRWHPWPQVHSWAAQTLRYVA